MIILDASSSTPPFEQIRFQIASGVAAGNYEAGHRLPTVRQLAADLGVAVNTVARAYRELEAGGVIETRGRSGSYVTGNQVMAKAKKAAAEYVQQIAALGLSRDEGLKLVRDYRTS